MKTQILDRYIFRGKRMDSGKWVEGVLCYDLDDEHVYMACPDLFYEDRFKAGLVGLVIHVYNEVNPSTIGQCTGLEDINGELIYEGDICKDTENKIFVIYWCEKTYRWMCVYKSNYHIPRYQGDLPLLHWNSSGNKLTIMGNIYDNIDLFH